MNEIEEQGELGRRVSAELLPFVEQPGEYIGGEGKIMKEKAK